MTDHQRFEVEMKFPLIVTRSEIERRLAALGAQSGAVANQSDRYFNHPARDFAQSDEALRIRSIGAENVLTYKGPKIDTRTKTRHEIELPLGPSSQTAEQMAEVLTLLSFRPVATVTKQRQHWHLQRGDWQFDIALDDVEQVGKFIEIELVATRDELPQAQAAVLQLASELGIENPEPRSYLRMLLERQVRGTPDIGTLAKFGE